MLRSLARLAVVTVAGAGIVSLAAPAQAGCVQLGTFCVEYGNPAIAEVCLPEITPPQTCVYV